MSAYTTLLSADKVRDFRLSVGYSHTFIADQLHIHKNTLLHWERYGISKQEHINAYADLIEDMQTNPDKYRAIETARARSTRGHTIHQWRIKKHGITPRYRFFKPGHKHHLFGITGVPTDSDRWLIRIDLGWNQHLPDGGAGHEYAWELEERDAGGTIYSTGRQMSLTDWRAFTKS